ncbi:hypothetical protein VA7868_01413 [Vibrio aerogenes CECT 7868]|uniref:Uncharacterized protein n=1 Tax=Vibrio aerogenes CECT 7868 TaxID=1216006 RepID=A0A1M5Y0D8_9VIBR|nr:hypothetical protein VA7868_01413 [Vibrio aerogenes CECT 7868]
MHHRTRFNLKNCIIFRNDEPFCRSGFIAPTQKEKHKMTTGFDHFITHRFSIFQPLRALKATGKRLSSAKKINTQFNLTICFIYKIKIKSKIAIYLASIMYSGPGSNNRAINKTFSSRFSQFLFEFIRHVHPAIAFS